jgi:hypothetical protein
VLLCGYLNAVQTSRIQQSWDALVDVVGQVAGLHHAPRQ